MEITQTASTKDLIYHAHHCVTVAKYKNTIGITKGLATSNALINKYSVRSTQLRMFMHWNKSGQPFCFGGMSNRAPRLKLSSRC